jgi:hypothetical protein
VEPDGVGCNWVDTSGMTDGSGVVGRHRCQLGRGPLPGSGFRLGEPGSGC